ncbi:RTX toxin [Allorhizobium undicola]|uniref:RTX toxin n=1 Tax=Allorhizobium undicola TaxID=78527 RepID=UPI003D3534E1
MTSISGFYRDPNAASYAATLFSGKTATRAATSSSVPDQNAEITGGFSAGQRALARIVEILSLADGEGSEAADVTETMGYVTGVSGTEGDDSLTLTGRALYNVETGRGNDSLMVKTGALAAVSTGDGNDRLQAEASAVTDVDAGEGNDSVELLGRLLMNIGGGEGDDTMKLSGAALIGIDGGSGKDSLYLEGSRIFASGGEGDDTLDIHATDARASVELAFAAGDGKDSITTDTGLAIRFSGYSAADITVTTAKNRLTLTFKGSDDRITINLEGAAASGTAPAYQFGDDEGQTLLRIL